MNSNIITSVRTVSMINRLVSTMFGCGSSLTAMLWANLFYVLNLRLSSSLLEIDSNIMMILK